MRARNGSMAIRSKLMLGLLGFATLPLITLGWFLCAEVNKARRAAVLQVQLAQQKGIEEMRDLRHHAARYKAEGIAREISRFLWRHPEADVADLDRVKPLRKAAERQATMGCVTTVELLVNDRPVNIVELWPQEEPPAAGATSPVPPAEKKPYTYIAKVPGTEIKVAAWVKDMGIEEPIDQLTRSIQKSGERAEAATTRAMEKLKLMLVIGVAGLVVGLTMVGGEVARTITKPIARLTTAAEKIRRGERDVDLDVGGGRELQLLASAFKRTTQELQDYTRSVEAKNLELDVARRLAVKANQDLQEAQDEMVQMEKMSSLGRLVAGVAHEINTPTGAIYNVTADASESLDSLVGGLHRLGEMTPDEFGLFRHYLDVAVARRLIPQRVSRKEKQVLCKHLEAAGVDPAKKHTELLAKCHIVAPSEGAELSALLQKHQVLGAFAALVEIHASMKISRTSAEKISKIVRALKFYSRGSQQATVVPTDINQTIRDALIILHNRLKAHVDVQVDLADDLPQASCTEGIPEVWVNLLTNACDAIEERGEGAEGAIRIRSFFAEHAVHVTVADNGQPMPPEIVSKIFDPFFTTKPPGRGTGLGLSVVMGTIRRNGGAIVLHGEGEFKEFEVTLPAEKPAYVGVN